MFDTRSVEEIKKKLMEAVAPNVGLSTEAGGFLDHIFGPVAVEIWTLYQSLDATLPIAFVDESSGKYIDLRCGEYGIKRKPGIKAYASMTMTGKAGLTVPKGITFLTADGLEYTLLDNVVLTSGTGHGTVESAGVGTIYNVPPDTMTQMVVTLPGLDTWSNAAAKGGVDAESDAALVSRLNDRLQRPATSGNLNHYQQWAKEVTGVGACKVVPLWDGPGTIKVVLAGPEKEPVEMAVVTACAEHIEDLRPVGAAVSVVSARGLAINVAATVTLESRTDLQAVTDALTAGIKEYIQGIAFTDNLLLYNRVAYILLGIDGVMDYTALTVNGGRANISMGAEQVPVLGAVVLT